MNEEDLSKLFNNEFIPSFPKEEAEEVKNKILVLQRIYLYIIQNKEEKYLLLFKYNDTYLNMNQLDNMLLILFANTLKYNYIKTKKYFY